MLHYNAMKKRFFTIFACIVMGGTVISASAAPKSNNVALDTVRTTFDDGRVARIYTVKKGTDIREGVALSYHPNGKLAVEAPYRNGKLDGVFRSFDENGKLHETIGYLDGEEEGFSIIYYENGKKKSRESYRRGVLNGVSEEWFENGKLRRQIPYENGQIHGVVKFYDEMGLLAEDMNFVRGIRNGIYHRYTFGKVTLEAEFQNNRCVKNCDF
ncbi:Antitoxin component YwqK of the YwqJK toxin-antitoxin module [Fibrobacter sp. UWB7]|nr:Antitoxin component YwqK of the YwqJK toxin-antitoxin module [Fibrobacter sp. UWB7]